MTVFETQSHSDVCEILYFNFNNTFKLCKPLLTVMYVYKEPLQMFAMKLYVFYSYA